MINGVGGVANQSFVNRSILSANKTLNNAINNLSTGFAINRAADDAAGLSITDKLTSVIKGFHVTERNISDGVSMIQTAEGGLSSIGGDLQRMRELVIDAKNGTNSADELKAIQQEINTLKDNISSTADSTNYNGNNLLDGSAGAVSLQTGTGQGQTTDIDLSGDFSSDAVDASGNINDGNSGAGVGDVIGDIDVESGDLDDVLAGIDTAIDNVSEKRSYLGAKQNALESRLDNISIAKENSYAARSRIMDTNYAAEAGIMLSAMFKQQASVAVKSQSNINSMMTLSLLPF